MSKLYDQLKNAAFSRRQALERKPGKAAASPASGQAELPASLADQEILDDPRSHWRDEIEGKLHEADRELIPGPAPALDHSEDDTGDIRPQHVRAGPPRHDSAPASPTVADLPTVPHGAGGGVLATGH